MGKEAKPFRFKRFSVWHHRSALKVGVDGVLVGLWADVSGAKRILDVGTGCGVIALMMAQRAPEAAVVGIDIDADSIEEAAVNAQDSPWRDRLTMTLTDFSDFASDLDSSEKFDLIVSNPPFFDSGVKDADSARLKARHQGELSPLSILAEGKRILETNGRISMIAPSESAGRLKTEASSLGYTLLRECLVRGHEKAPYKRVLLEWIYNTDEVDGKQQESSSLTLESSPGIPTEEYRNLGKDFYLKF